MTALLPGDIITKKIFPSENLTLYIYKMFLNLKLNENSKNQTSPVGGGMERENKERGILIEGAILGFGRNLISGNLPGIHKDNPS